jgi:DNA-directed RNA polymerase subunit E'/Rpb7
MRAATGTMAYSHGGLFIESVLEKRIVLPIKDMNENMNENILREIRRRCTGKCIEEGFVHPESIELKNFSIIFKEVFESSTNNT